MLCSPNRRPKVACILTFFFDVLGPATVVAHGEGNAINGGLLWSSAGGGWKAILVTQVTPVYFARLACSIKLLRSSMRCCFIPMHFMSSPPYLGPRKSQKSLLLAGFARGTRSPQMPARRTRASASWLAWLAKGCKNNANLLRNSIRTGRNWLILHYRAEICAPSFCCILVGALVRTFVSFGGILWPVAYRNGFALVYEGTFFDKLTIFSQWPNPCDSLDAQFADGWLTNSAAVAQNVGHYLKKNGANNETLKLIITQPNDIASGELSIAYDMFQYFETDFNQGVSPGGFLWNPGLVTPYRSPQIFEEYLGVDGFKNAIMSIHNSTITTTLFEATTIDDPSVGALAGQAVEVLLLTLNSNVPIILIGKTIVHDNIQPLAAMATHVVFNERVRLFVYVDDESIEAVQIIEFIQSNGLKL